MNKSISNIFQRVKSLLNALKNDFTWGVLCIMLALFSFGGQLTTMMIQIAHYGDPAYSSFATSSFIHMLIVWVFIFACMLMPDSIKYKKVFNG